MRCRTAPAVLLSVLAALVLTTSHVHAAGFDLRWNSCAADGGVSNQDFACDTDEGTHKMVAAFTLAQPLTNMFRFDAVIDIIVADHAVVPPLWEIFGCHSFGLQADATADPLAVNCDDFGAGAGAAVISTMNSDGTIAPADAASHRRILAVGGVNPPGVTLDADQEYFLFNLVLDHTSTTGPEACAGCSMPVCIVLNEIRLTTTTPSETTLTEASTPGLNFATWQQGTGADCMAVPVKHTTWSRVKGMYR